MAIIPAMLALTGNAIFNLHIHKQDSGGSYVHAHPFQTDSSTNKSSHSHNGNDCVSIQQITSFLFIVITAIVLKQVFTKVFNKTEPKLVQANYGFSASPLNNRPPPFA